MVIFMTEQKYESKFHKMYVGGDGEVEEEVSSTRRSGVELKPIDYDEILKWYRRYVGDAQAELPEEFLAELRLLGKI